MNYRDLIGLPWRDPRTLEPRAGLDCLDVTVEVLRRCGASITRADVEAGRVQLDCIGTSAGAAERVGDVLYTEPRNGRPASVYVLVEPSQGRAITSTHDRGVSLVRIGHIEEPLTVWRGAW